jgi:putative DNA primase/helicase
MTDINGRSPSHQRRSGSPFAAIAEQLNARIHEVAKRLLGEPNRDLSTRAQLRFGRNGSLAVEIAGARRGQWYDHENKLGGGALDLVRRCTGLSGRAAAEGAATEFGIAVEQQSRPKQRRIVATYDYRDEAGALLFQVVRYAPKTFRQRRPDGSGGWSWRVRGIRQVPYRLPELLAERDAPVFIVEGEKDADRLARLGLVATCNAGGANTWPDAVNRFFEGRTVYILPDNDAAGRSHAEKVAAALHGIADSVRIVFLPDLPPGGDVSDWLAAGGDGERLIELCKAPPLWQSDQGDAFAEVPDDVLVPYCDEALTLAFSERHVDDLRYCEVFGRWFEWRAGRWREDVKRRAFTRARRLCRDHCATALRGIDDEKAAARIGAGIASAKTVAAIVNLARADVRHATAPEDWDADPWVLNTPGGIVDLRSGRMSRTTGRCSARRSRRSRRRKQIVRAGGGSSTRLPAAIVRCRRSLRGSRATA